MCIFKCRFNVMSCLKLRSIGRAELRNKLAITTVYNQGGMPFQVIHWNWFDIRKPGTDLRTTMPLQGRYFWQHSPVLMANAAVPDNYPPRILLFQWRKRHGISACDNVIGGTHGMWGDFWQHVYDFGQEHLTHAHWATLRYIMYLKKESVIPVLYFHPVCC